MFQIRHRKHVNVQAIRDILLDILLAEVEIALVLVSRSRVHNTQRST